MFSTQALIILTFLVPGFISMAFLDMLTPARKRDDLHKIINALIFSLIVYALYSLAFHDYPVVLIEKTVGNEKHYELNILRRSVIVILAFSMALPTVFAFLQKYDLHMKLFRKLKVTDKTSRSNVWFDVFTDIKRHVVINFEDGRRLYGWPEWRYNPGRWPYPRPGRPQASRRASFRGYPDRDRCL